MTSTELILDKIRNELDNITIDELLRGLIADSDLMEVVCALDMIAQENGRELEMYRLNENKNGIKEYPAV